MILKANENEKKEKMTYTVIKYCTPVMFVVMTLKNFENELENRFFGVFNKNPAFFFKF